jgi:hypothetical protein
MNFIVICAVSIVKLHYIYWGAYLLPYTARALEYIAPSSYSRVTLAVRESIWCEKPMVE